MAEIRTYFGVRHLRSESGFHVLRFRRGALSASGRGLSFFFLPHNTSVAEIPVGDRELPFLFHGRSSDFQDVTVQGAIGYRVTDPELLGTRLDFSLDLTSGALLEDPLHQLAEVFNGHAQQIAVRYLGAFDVRALLTAGLADIQAHLEAGLADVPSVRAMGLEVISVRVSRIAPTPELEKALQTPTREALQQEADRATFDRRALAVENERAIKENELKNQIELARRELTLIEQRGENEARRVEREVQTRAIEAEARAAAVRVDAAAQADRIRQIEGAQAATERERMAAYEGVPPAVLMGLAAQALANKLESIDHLNVSPDLLGPGLQRLLEASSAKLGGG